MTDSRNASRAWSERLAPTLEDFEILALDALESLPEPFRELVRDVTCVVQDFPEDEDLDELDMESPFDLLGLFRGHGMTEEGATPFTGQLPNRVWLYRRPILDYWAEHDDETLGQIVTHVLVHEIGHHFGYSDEDLQAIEGAAEAEER